jgi:hypothetical protein
MFGYQPVPIKIDQLGATPRNTGVSGAKSEVKGYQRAPGTAPFVKYPCRGTNNIGVDPVLTKKVDPVSETPNFITYRLSLLNGTMIVSPTVS